MPGRRLSDYPRGGIAQPGLTAGTCLRKGFVALFPEGMKRRLGSLADKKVAVLGLVFKAVHDADAVVLAANHSDFCGPAPLRRIAAAAADGALDIDP